MSLQTITQNFFNTFVFEKLKQKSFSVICHFSQLNFRLYLRMDIQIVTLTQKLGCKTRILEKDKFSKKKKNRFQKTNKLIFAI